MSWDTKASYPMTALRTIQVKATDWQRARWEAEGKRLGVSRGAFLAWLNLSEHACALPTPGTSQAQALGVACRKVPLICFT